MRTKNYIPIIKEALSSQPMTKEEIYTYLKENNHLSEEVIKAEKENVYIPEHFIKACMLNWRKEEKFASRASVSSLVYEDDKYRMKTTEEMENSKVVAEQEANVEILKEIDTLMPIVKTLQNAGEPLSCNDLMKINKDLENRIFQVVNSKLIQLEKAGILKSELIKKKNYYYIANNSKAETEKELYKVVANRTVRGFLD